MNPIEVVVKKSSATICRIICHHSNIYIGSALHTDIQLLDQQIPALAGHLRYLGNKRFYLRDLTQTGLFKVGQSNQSTKETYLTAGEQIRIRSYCIEIAIKNTKKAIAYPEKTKTITNNLPPTQQTKAFIHNKDTGDSLLLNPKQSITIGHSEDNDLAIKEDPFVSAFHCLIQAHKGHWHIYDLSSSNGTYINGLRIHQTQLPRSAKIVIGHTELYFQLGASANETKTRYQMIGQSKSMQQLYSLIDRFANLPDPVLITGQSGTGKELVAKALHTASSRAKQPYLAVNCGALSSQLIESELFGYTKGAFTGANMDKKGAFEAACGGTLFLDEIGELSLELQPKLLRVLETSSIRRVGGIREVDINTRVVAATHRNLADYVRQGLFREDLFHRLFVLCIPITPLKNRPEDIKLLTQHFVKKQAKIPIEILDCAYDRLLSHHWPGNIRELRNVITRSLAMLDGTRLSAASLCFTTLSAEEFTPPTKQSKQPKTKANDDQKQYIQQVLIETNWNRSETARRLGIARSTLHEKLKKWGFTTPQLK